MLPEHKVGLVILANGAPGWALTEEVERRLLEVLFDAQAQASATMRAKSIAEEGAAERRLVSVPADPTESAKLAKRYRHPLLGPLVVTSGAKTIFDFGEWRTEVGTRKNADGTVSFVMTDPGVATLSSYYGFTAGTSGKRTLVVHEEKREYVFTEE